MSFPLTPSQRPPTPPSLDRVLDGLAADDPAFVTAFVLHHGDLVAGELERRGVPPEALDAAVQDVGVMLLVLARDAGSAGRGRPPAAELLHRAVEVVAGPSGPTTSTALGRHRHRSPGRPPTGASGPRALHLVDLENLIGGPRRAERWFQPTVRAYEAVAPVRAWDQVVAAADVTLRRRTIFEIPRWRYVAGYGPEGADRALLREAPPEWVSARFERLVIGSGDHAFVPLATQVRAAGTEVVVVARPRQLSADLSRAATTVRLLPDLPPDPDASR